MPSELSLHLYDYRPKINFEHTAKNKKAAKYISIQQLSGKTNSITLKRNKSV
ncbi:hypothetical protein [Pectinatus haikarae]|uniref:hypothetical protein n=1 Tax=Pectinatus haikarae TaxID=349096 RepID=UPI0018C53989|nr:hypothetical protein [Pectinatus haikarae]